MAQLYKFPQTQKRTYNPRPVFHTMCNPDAAMQSIGRLFEVMGLQNENYDPFKFKQEIEKV